jgi:hypothetical protein
MFFGDCTRGFLLLLLLVCDGLGLWWWKGEGGEESRIYPCTHNIHHPYMPNFGVSRKEEQRNEKLCSYVSVQRMW